MTNLEKNIIEKLPQIPYVIDQVGEALKWAQETLNEGTYNNMLKTVTEVVDYVNSISEPHFFKVHYVTASILSFIPKVLESENLSKFSSASKSVEDALSKLVVTPKIIEEKGCFKGLMLHLIPLAKANIDLFTIALIGIKNDLEDLIAGIKQANIKAPITGNDYITVLGYALVMANIRMANLSLPQWTHHVYNDISVILNNDINY